MYYVLFYEKAPDYAEKQKPYSPAHRDHVFAAADSGALILAGSLYEPDDGAALLVFQADGPAIAEAFAAADPYVQHGIVNRWQVRRWDVVVGGSGDSKR